MSGLGLRVGGLGFEGSGLRGLVEGFNIGALIIRTGFGGPIYL